MVVTFQTTAGPRPKARAISRTRGETRMIGEAEESKNEERNRAKRDRVKGKDVCSMRWNLGSDE